MLSLRSSSRFSDVFDRLCDVKNNVSGVVDFHAHVPRARTHETGVHEVHEDLPANGVQFSHEPHTFHLRDLSSDEKSQKVLPTFSHGISSSGIHSRSETTLVLAQITAPRQDGLRQLVYALGLLCRLLPPPSTCTGFRAQTAMAVRS